MPNSRANQKDGEAQPSAPLTLHYGCRTNKVSSLNITRGGTSKVPPRGPHPWPKSPAASPATGPQAPWLGTDSLRAAGSHHAGTGCALPPCRSHGSATAAAGLPAPPFIYISLIYFIPEFCSGGSGFVMLWETQELEMQFKYFSEAWCRGGTARREKPKDALGEQGWGRESAPPKATPLPASHTSAPHPISGTLLIRCFKKLRAPL